MAMNPGHTRRLPTGDAITRVVRAFLRRMRYDAQARPRAGLQHWLEPLATALEPVIIRFWRQGAKDAIQRLSAMVRGKSARWITKKAAAVELDLFRFDLFNPRILDAIRAEVFTLCQATLDTLTIDIERAMVQLRLDIGEGLAGGETTAQINRRVGQLFADPYRAARIGQTESSRAVHSGQALAARESGIVAGKRWLAASDACPLCLKLNGKEVGLDEAFDVDPKGGQYAAVWHPPRH